MKSGENQYYSPASMENRVQGEWEATNMKLEKVVNFVNDPREKQVFDSLREMGYETVGSVVEAIKAGKIDEATLRKIFVDDVRVCVPIYTTAVNYLHRHDLIDKATEEKEKTGHVDYGEYIGSEGFKERNSDARESKGIPVWFGKEKGMLEKTLSKNPSSEEMKSAVLDFGAAVSHGLGEGITADWVRQYALFIDNLPEWPNKKVVTDFITQVEQVLKREPKKE